MLRLAKRRKPRLSRSLVFPAEIVLAAKGRQQLLVQQRLANGLVCDLSRDALFSSSDPSVVSVTGGVVHARRAKAWPRFALKPPGRWPAWTLSWGRSQAVRG